MKHHTLKAGRRVAFDRMSSRNYDANGFLHIASCPLTKEAVNPYYGREIPGWDRLGLDPDRLYFGFRPAGELQKALSSANGIPLLLDHHLDSAEAPQKQARIGAVGTEAEWNAPYLRNALAVWDSQAIRGIESGEVRELSSAYLFTPEMGKGTHRGVAYDFVMRDIVFNHVALVREGRAGPDVCVADAVPAQGSVKVRSEDNAVGDPVGPVEEKARPDQDAERETVLGVLAGRITPDPATAQTDVEPVKDPDAATDGDDRHASGGGNTDTAATDGLAARLQSLLERTTDPDLTQAFRAVIAALEESQSQSRPASEAVGAALAADAGLVAACVDAERRGMRKARSLAEAARAVRPLTGELDPFAFDAAVDIFGAALRAAGYDPASFSPESWPGMVHVLLETGRAAGTPAPAQASTGKDVSPFRNLKSISLEVR